MIDGQDGASFGESVSLIDDRPIGDGGLMCVQVDRLEKTRHLMHPSDLHRAVTINHKVH